MGFQEASYRDFLFVVVDFKSGIEKLSKEDQEQYKDNYDDHPEIFALMDPIDGAIEALKELNNHFDLYILSTAPWDNPNAWKQKREWIEKYFGKGKENIFYKKVILSHYKNLNRGEILIDDRPNNGQLTPVWSRSSLSSFLWKMICCSGARTRLKNEYRHSIKFTVSL